MQLEATGRRKPIWLCTAARRRRSPSSYFGGLRSNHSIPAVFRNAISLTFVASIPLPACHCKCCPFLARHSSPAPPRRQAVRQKCCDFCCLPLCRRRTVQVDSLLLVRPACGRPRPMRFRPLHRNLQDRKPAPALHPPGPHPPIPPALRPPRPEQTRYFGTVKLNPTSLRMGLEDHQRGDPASGRRRRGSAGSPALR